MKPPWSIKYGYHLSTRIATRRRASFARELFDGNVGHSRAAFFPRLDIRLVSMLGKDSIPEMARAVTSFTRQAGAQPAEWVMVSDGSLDTDDYKCLASLCDSVVVRELDDVVGMSVPDFIRQRARASWLYRKLAVLMSFGNTTPYIFVDSDVVFFSGVKDIPNVVAKLAETPAYLRDCAFAQDERILPLNPH